MANRVQALDRALEILETLATEGKGLGVTELSQRVGLHKSTVHRMLATFAEWGYVEKNPEDDRYKLGMKVIDLGSIYLNNIELKTEALPYLRELREKSRYPVHLARLEDGQVVYIEKVDVINSIRMYSQIGRRVPVHCTALGKAMAAHLSMAEVEDIIKRRGLASITGNTITDKSKFMEELDITRRRGYAVDDEENEAGIRCVAAPVLDYRGKVIAAISTSGPKEVFTYEKIDELKDCVMDTARKVSVRMGYIE
jgi:DNA-binding IclR family transcriptional regulator